MGGGRACAIICTYAGKKTIFVHAENWGYASFCTKYAYTFCLFIDIFIRIHGLRVDYSGFRKRAINQSLMTRQLILSTRGSQKIHNTIGTPPCTFRQLLHNVHKMFHNLIPDRIFLHNHWLYSLTFLKLCNLTQQLILCLPLGGGIQYDSSVIEQITMGGYIISIFAQMLGSLWWKKRPSTSKVKYWSKVKKIMSSKYSHVGCLLSIQKQSPAMLACCAQILFWVSLSWYKAPTVWSQSTL